jgi:uncharacterized membrane protein
MRITIAFSVLSLAVAIDANAQASFAGLGDFPSDGFSSAAYGVSADGAVVVGYGTNAPFYGGVIGPACFGSQAFRWTEADGMQAIEMPYEGDSSASDTTLDGSVVIGGLAGKGDLCLGPDPFRWTEVGGVEFLGFQGGAAALSADGSVVVGTKYSPFRAVRWTAEELLDLGTLGAISGPGNSAATDVTSDGSLVVGDSSDATHDHTPFRWTAATGMLPLGNVQGRALAVAPEGSCIAGRASDGSGRPHQPFLWSEGSGFAWLGYLDDGSGELPSMWVNDTSTGCATVVGYAQNDNNPPGIEAFVWQGRAIRSVSDLLTEQGADVTGWSLANATAVSADGRTIVGYGINPDGWNEAWIAHVPELDGAVQALVAFAALLVRRRRQSR